MNCKVWDRSPSSNECAQARLDRRIDHSGDQGPEEVGGLEADYVIDATGNATAIETALGHVAFGGTFMVFGVASPAARVSYSPFTVYQREITIVGSMAIVHTYGQAVQHGATACRAVRTAVDAYVCP